MCDHCVIESVKQRMLSRRDLLRSAPAAALAVLPMRCVAERTLS